MTLPRIAIASIVTALFFSTAFDTKDAQAAPITYTFTGIIDGSAQLVSFGTLAGYFSVGDAYTLTTTVDQDAAPDFVSSGSSHLTQQWDGNVTASLAINGQTFAVQGPLQSRGRSVAQAVTGIRDQLIFEATGQTATSRFPGSSTSTLTGIDEIRLNWDLIDNDGQNDILDFADPRFPATINLADWISQDVEVRIADNNESGQTLGFAYFRDNGEPVFDTLVSSNGGTGVPAPGALVLLGFGLLGLGLRRSTA